MSNLRYLCLFAHSGVQHILCCSFFFIVFLCLVYPMKHVSLDCPFLITPSVFSSIYLLFLGRRSRAHCEDWVSQCLCSPGPPMNALLWIHWGT